MRLTRMTVLALIAAGWVASAATASARTLKVSRQPDATIDICLAAKCAPVAVGDFNGDRVDDVVFQQSLNAERQLVVVLGPLGESPQPATTLQFVDANALLAVDVADMNGDGQDELIVADSSVRGTQSLAVQAVNIIDFDMLSANNRLPEGQFAERNRIGLNQGPYVWNRTVRFGEGQRPSAGAKLTVRAADLNGDGVKDLALGVDASDGAVASSREAATTNGRSAATASEVIVQFIPATFWTVRPSDAAVSPLYWPIRTIETEAGRDNVRITGLGACAHGGLAGVTDVTGDGAADIIVRRCEGGTLPDQLGLVTGRATWPSTLQIDGAIGPSTPPEPPAPPRPGPEPVRPPRGGDGYIQIDPRGPARNVFDALPTFFTADVNGDGVLDIGLGLADKTHVWLGGGDIGARLLDNRSDRIFLGAGLGGTMVNRTWRPTDLDGDGHRDLAVTRLRSAVPQKLDPAGNARFENAPSEPVYVYAQNRDADAVIDVTSDAADGILSDARYTLWAFGDFNGDGQDDMMLGSPASSLESVYPVIYGPYLRR